MARLVLLILVAASAVAGCAAAVEKQWYKPNADYTVAEFERDQAACTRNRVLDEACLREKGWVALSGDRTYTPPAATPGRGPRY